MHTPGWGRPSCTSTTPTPRGVPDARGTVPSAGPHSLHQAQPSTRQRTPALAVLSRPGGQQGAPEPPWRSDPAQAGEEGAASPEEDGAAGRGGAGTATALSDPGLWASPGRGRADSARGGQGAGRASHGEAGPSRASRVPPRRGGRAPQSTRQGPVGCRRPCLPRPPPRVAALLVVSILRSSPRPLAWKGTPALLLSCWAVSVAGRQGLCRRSPGGASDRGLTRERTVGAPPWKGVSAPAGGGGRGLSSARLRALRARCCPGEPRWQCFI